jgi:outer membrane protein
MTLMRSSYAKYWALFALTLVASGSARGEILSLLDAYTLARQSAPELSQARFKVDIAGAREDVAMAKILPQVNIFGQWSDNRVRYDSFQGNSNQDYPGERYGVQIRQPLLNVSNGLEVQRMKMITQKTTAELQFSEMQLLLELAGAYLNVLLADAELDQKTAELDALEIQLLEVQALSLKKMAAVTDVFETQARRDSVRADLITSKGRSAVAREELIKLVAKRGVEPRRILDTVTLSGVSPNLESAIKAALAKHPMIAVAERDLDAADKAISREKGSWIPNVDLTYSFQHSDVGFDNLRSPPRDTSIISIGVTYPLFEGGAGSARLRGAWAEYYSALTRLQSIKRDVEANTRSAWVGLSAAEERVVAAGKAAETASINLKATSKAYQLGAARASDRLFALAQNTGAQRESSRAKLDYALAWLDLQLATGADPESVAPILSNALHGN